MPTDKKTKIVQELTEKLKKAKSLVLTDYSGLSVRQQQALRSKIKEVGGEFRVVKNTLLKLAFRNSQFSHLAEIQQSRLSNFQFTGPTAILFAYKDEITPIKVLVEFSQELKLPKIKIGLFEGKMIAKEAILELAKIPSKKELLGKLVYLVNSPLSGLVNVLSADMRRVLQILSTKSETSTNVQNPNDQNSFEFKI